MNPPKVRFLTKIYHPNIGEYCVLRATAIWCKSAAQVPLILIPSSILVEPWRGRVWSSYTFPLTRFAGLG